MRTFLVDTNAFLIFLLADVPPQTKDVKSLFLEAKNRKIKLFVPSIVIFEIIFSLEKYYGLDKKTVGQKLDMILSSDYLDVENREAFLLGLEIYSQEKISFTDCYLVARSRLKEYSLFTFDQKLRKLTAN